MLDYKAGFYFLARPPERSAVAVLVMQKMIKDGDPPGHPAMWVDEHSPMKFLASQVLPK